MIPILFVYYLYTKGRSTGSPGRSTGCPVDCFFYVYTIGRSTGSPGRSIESPFVKKYASEIGNSIGSPVLCLLYIYKRAFMIPWAVCRMPCFLNIIYLLYDVLYDPLLFVVQVYTIWRSTVSPGRSTGSPVFSTLFIYYKTFYRIPCCLLFIHWAVYTIPCCLDIIYILKDVL